MHENFNNANIGIRVFLLHENKNPSKKTLPKVSLEPMA